MSSGSDRIIEIQQEQFNRQIAKKLGITYDEFLELEYEINTEESEDGFIYNYILEFNENSPKEILEKIIGIEQDKFVWFAPWEFENNDYDEERYQAIISNKEFYAKYQNEIHNYNLLNEVELKDNRLNPILKRQIFIGIIGALETFLSDAFINLTLENDEYFKNFVETYPDFKKRKFELRHLYVEKDRIKETGKKIMLDIIYHDLPKVSKMYISTFKINFPKIGSVIKQILTRHDLVHRNGKTKDGDEVIITKTSITQLIELINDFVANIVENIEKQKQS